MFEEDQMIIELASQVPKKPAWMIKEELGVVRSVRRIQEVINQNLGRRPSRQAIRHHDIFRHRIVAAMENAGLSRYYCAVNGNVAGYSYERNVAVSPVAKYPFKTLMHEIGHVVQRQTSEQGLEEYREHRGIKEFQAKSTAYLTMNVLRATDVFRQI